MEKYLFEKLDKLQQVRDLIVNTPGCTSTISTITNLTVAEMNSTQKEIIVSLAKDMDEGNLNDVKANATIYCTLTGINSTDVVREIKWQQHLLAKNAQK